MRFLFFAFFFLVTVIPFLSAIDLTANLIFAHHDDDGEVNLSSRSVTIAGEKSPHLIENEFSSIVNGVLEEISTKIEKKEKKRRKRYARKKSKGKNKQTAKKSVNQQQQKNAHEKEKNVAVPPEEVAIKIEEKEKIMEKAKHTATTTTTFQPKLTSKATNIAESMKAEKRQKKPQIDNENIRAKEEEEEKEKIIELPKAEKAGTPEKVVPEWEKAQIPEKVPEWEKAPTPEKEVPVLEKAPTPEKEVPVLEKAPTPEKEVPLLEKAPTPEKEVPVLEKAPTPEKEVPLLEKAPTPEKEVPVLEKAPTPEKEVPVLEKAPTPEKEVPVLEKAPTPENEANEMINEGGSETGENLKEEDEDDDHYDHEGDRRSLGGDPAQSETDSKNLSNNDDDDEDEDADEDDDDDGKSEDFTPIQFYHENEDIYFSFWFTLQNVEALFYARNLTKSSEKQDFKSTIDMSTKELSQLRAALDEFASEAQRMPRIMNRKQANMRFPDKSAYDKVRTAISGLNSAHRLRNQTLPALVRSVSNVVPSTGSAAKLNGGAIGAGFAGGLAFAIGSRISYDYMLQNRMKQNSGKNDLKNNNNDKKNGNKNDNNVIHGIDRLLAKLNGDNVDEMRETKKGREKRQQQTRSYAYWIAAGIVFATLILSIVIFMRCIKQNLDMPPDGAGGDGLQSPNFGRPNPHSGVRRLPHSQNL